MCRGQFTFPVPPGPKHVCLRRVLHSGGIGNGSLILGACTTHAAIEDGRVPDVTGGVLPAVAKGIAYRAVRTRGTIGGSLAHADPAADWISCLAALNAQVILFGPSGRRNLPVAEFMIGTFEPMMDVDEILEAVRIPTLGPEVRWGYYKVCRKTGDFAHAIGAVLFDPDRGACRVVVGATDSAPIVLDDTAQLFGGNLVPPLHQRFDGRPQGRGVHTRQLRCTGPRLARSFRHSTGGDGPVHVSIVRPVRTRHGHERDRPRHGLHQARCR